MMKILEFTKSTLCAVFIAATLMAQPLSLQAENTDSTPSTASDSADNKRNQGSGDAQAAGTVEHSVLPATPTAAPEEVLVGFTPTGLARNDTHLFVAQAGFGLETCQLDPGQSTTVLQRVNFNGGGSLPLLSRCHFVHHGLVADNSFVYLRDSDLKIKRLPVAGGMLETLVNDASACCGLALDETHLYWARRENGGANNLILRIPKGGGPVEQVASVANADNTYFIRSLALDETHVYWVDGKTGIDVINQPGIGAVRKAPKGGGPVVVLADSADGIQHPGNIALDATHVYWTELDTGRARRVAKNGGAVTDFNAVQDNIMAGGLAVNDNDVFWTDTNAGYAGRVRRAGKGGGAVTDIAIGILGPGRPLLINNYVYWPQSGGVYRLPLGAGEIAVDFSIDAIEVTQTIQDISNSVPLVAEKYAYVRVYPRVDHFTGQTPKVQLRGFKGGVELDWSPLPPLSPHAPIFVNGASRLNLNNTFNFKLPPHWREGSITLQAEINYDGAINELNNANNTRTVAVNFNAKKPLCVEMVSVKTSPQTATTSDPGYMEMLDWLESAYPVPAVLIDVGGTIAEAGGPYELPDDTNKVLARMGWYRLWHDHNQWQKCGAAHFFGMVHQSEMSAGGIGYRPGWSAWGVMANHSWSQTIADNAPWYAPHGGAILAHEIAHNKGRKHVDCGDPDGTDDSYPYHPCNMGSGFDGSDVGFDYLDEAVIGGWDAGDLMSYSMSIDKPRWPSDYTYEAIYDKIPDSSLMTAATSEALMQADYVAPDSAPLAQNLVTANSVLLVSALVTPTTNSAVYDQLFVAPAGAIAEHTLIDTAATTLVNANGQYTLRLLDAADAPVGELKFDLPDSDGPPWMSSAGRSFVVALPYSEQTARVALLQSGAQVATRVASANAPSVKVLEPNGGESYAGSLTIRWEAKDLDGDPLSFLVQYSPDNGATWRMVETESFSTTLQIDDVSHLPGTEGLTGLVRVFANDGLRTASDVSDRPFSLRPQPPQAHISNPSAGEVVAFGDILTLAGDAFDAEDGRVANEGLSWTMDGNAVGVGREVEVKGLGLGAHTVRLTARDSDNMVAIDEHTFFVQRQYCDGNNNRLDLVFVIDNSGPMNQHVPAFCRALPSILNDLANLGLVVRHQVFDMASATGGGTPAACATQTVQSRWPGAINHPADWGKATATIAAHYEWQANATRLIAPVTNQGPEDGNPTADPGADRDAITQAIISATVAAAAVSPLMMPPADSVNFFANMQLVSDLASATGGEVMQWGGQQLNIAEKLQDVQAQLGCSPELDTVNPGVVSGGQEVCLVGRHLWPGVAVQVGSQPPTRARVNADGAVACFDVPAATGAGEHPLRLDRPGAPPNENQAKVTIKPASSPMLNFYLPLIQK